MKFLVRLKPLTPFFFGTDKTFSDETLHDVESSYFPQQTHILGMIRKYILQTNNLLTLRDRGRWVKNSRFKEAFELVGGYDKNNQSQTDESFGAINSISPIFIISTKDKHIKDYHFVAPFDVGLDIEINKSQSIYYVAGKKRDKIYNIKNYNPKKGLVNALTTSKFWDDYINNNKDILESNLLSFDDVFKEVKQVGIKRDKQTKSVKEDDEGSFYQKTSYTFVNDEYEFAFILDLKEDILPQKDGFVYLGAERSFFSIKIEEFNDEDILPKTHISGNKFVALSDVEVENFEDIEFMINQNYIPHAYMIRSNKKQKRASAKNSKSTQRCYIPKGSVLFLKDNKTLKFNNIGYNQIKEIK